jgi:hypothetical protein
MCLGHEEDSFIHIYDSTCHDMCHTLKLFLYDRKNFGVVLWYGTVVVVCAHFVSVVLQMQYQNHVQSLNVMFVKRHENIGIF